MTIRHSTHKNKYANTTLDAARVVLTMERLSVRIEERFPESSLLEVSRALLDIARQTEKESAYIERPIYALRALSYLLIAFVVGLLTIGIWVLFADVFNETIKGTSNLLLIIEASSNEAVMISLLIFFLFSIERKMKRKRALAAIHKLRAISHVIDMHQLTKDPSTYFSSYKPTASSPQRNNNESGMIRYLDYCSEMLALTGKLAAMYIQQFDDSVTLSAANDVENLTTQLSRKIWQKIMIAYNSPLQNNFD